MKKYNVAIVGATGAVGQELLKVLRERNFPVGELRLLASSRSAGKTMEHAGETYTIGLTDAQAFQGIDIALFAGGSASTEFAQAAVDAGAVVIDNSSAFRMNPDVPLVVPEVNPEDVDWHKGIIANPNCSTIIMAVALKPIHDAAKIQRVVVSTYQAVSGAGKEGITELTEQTRQVLAGEAIAPQVFAHPIAFNLIPHIDVFQDGDYTKEEWKMIKETQKIMHEPSMKITATTVRVPVYRSHSESINLELEQPLSAAEAKEVLAKAPGVIVVDDVTQKKYPMPIDTSDHDEVYVGRIREDKTVTYGLNLWVVADQIRKGAATNAIQIAETLIARHKL
ncbi:aspartate-semialdehyde dehydrogenase [Heliophilum fasciatum]|uniref:Aspartate-semialdehyde dehydrogenase n=1 Tax=Heliophilum fasciatum TaxID=35700 RepID=A0A4R2RPB4_9FIRM|nr:aspartate-semialdehyde dehydrogenase [Heliophilum fasciatum]MCW2277881.1 aspartate-semialdehyde dehydrogenase [Heliophilum fasciatum]TCP64549.1 aspartate-semialdehyde dehydrogenase [Heliophilum fasciatum]